MTNNKEEILICPTSPVSRPHEIISVDNVLTPRSKMDDDIPSPSIMKRVHSSPGSLLQTFSPSYEAALGDSAKVAIPLPAHILVGVETPNMNNISIVAEDESDKVRTTMLDSPMGKKSLLMPRPNSGSLSVSEHNKSAGFLDMQVMLQNMSKTNHESPKVSKIIRRLKSEGTPKRNKKDVDLDGDEEGGGGSPTRNMREMSFTECGVKDQSALASIFNNRSTSASAGSIRLARHLNSASFSECSLDALRITATNDSISSSLDGSGALEWLKEVETGGAGQVAEAASSKFLTRPL